MSYHHAVRVRYVDCDMQGVVYNAHYLTFVDDGFDCWMRALEPDFENVHGWEVMLKKAEILLGGRLPDLRMNHGGLKRTKQSLQREFLLHRALIESLAGEEKTAREFLALAGKIAEVDQEVLNGQAPLLRQLGKLTD